MSFSWTSYKKPFICLAPMDGYTDKAFRLLIRELCNDAILFTEFMSADGIVHDARPIMEELKLEDKEKPVIVQIFGKDAQVMAEAAKVVESKGASGVDINMGCPAKKVVNHMHGSALMKDIDLACQIVDQVKKSVKIPVSVKTRLGWEDSSNLIPFVSKLIDYGLDAITIHGRTYKQAFKGQSNWEPIYELKKNINIPVIGNGDIKDYQTAKDKIGNLDGVMIGRATFGNPWVIKEVYDYLVYNKIFETSKMSFHDKLPIIKRHIELLWQTKNQKGIFEARKHLACYVKGIEGAASYRNQLVRINSVEEAVGILSSIN